MYIYLSSLFVGLLILSNIISVKLFEVGGFVLPAAAIVYVVTYLLTDVIGEVYGKKMAMRTVKAGLLAQIIASIFILISIYLPPAEHFGLQAEYQTILAGGFRITIASLTAYVSSQFLDVGIFHYLKKKHGTKKLWLRNNTSTIVSQLVDTGIFIIIAFIGTVPTSVLISMIVVQYIFKFIVAVADTPITYLLVKLARSKGGEAL